MCLLDWARVICIRWDVHLTKDRSRARYGARSLALRAVRDDHVSICRVGYCDCITDELQEFWVSYRCTCACNISLAMMILFATQCNCARLTIMSAL